MHRKNFLIAFRYIAQLGEQYRRFLESETVARVIALNGKFDM